MVIGQGNPPPVPGSFLGDVFHHMRLMPGLVAFKLVLDLLPSLLVPPVAVDPELPLLGDLCCGEEFPALHRQANDLPRLRALVLDFLHQFAAGSLELLQYVGLSIPGNFKSA